MMFETSIKKMPPMRAEGTDRTIRPFQTNTEVYRRNTRHQVRFQKEREEKYRNALNSLPQRGGNLHSALMSVCNLGVIAGVSGQCLQNEITATGRWFKRGEVAEAIEKAQRDAGRQTNFTPHAPSCGMTFSEILNTDPERKKVFQEKLIQQGGGTIDPFGADVWESSNPHPESSPRSGGLAGSECCADMLLFLKELYRPTDLLYIGSGFEKSARQSAHIRSAAAWIEFFSAELEAIRQERNEREQLYKIRKLQMNFPYIIPNPLSGEPTAEGSFRSDANVKEFRYIVVEADHLSLEKQLPLICGLRLAVVSLTYSGGKSIHALLDAAAYNNGRPITNPEEWQRIVKEGVYGFLTPCGFDPADKNASRLSRLPGIWRQEKNQFQKLLYINRKGGALCLTK